MRPLVSSISAFCELGTSGRAMAAADGPGVEGALGRGAAGRAGAGAAFLLYATAAARGPRTLHSL